MSLKMSFSINESITLSPPIENIPKLTCTDLIKSFNFSVLSFVSLESIQMPHFLTIT